MADDVNDDIDLENWIHCRAFIAFNILIMREEVIRETPRKYPSPGHN